MSVGCSTSERRVSARHQTLKECKRVRSTKGASKARRDHINGEIRTLRALLPISSEDQEQLSYLHSMSLICTFIRKSVMLQGLHENSSDVSLPCESFLQTLPGFIVALTKEGKLVYVSENVCEYLDLSMVDVLQADSFYDMIDIHDVETVKVILREDNTSAERSFVCRMQTSKAFRIQFGSCCSMMVRGRFQAGSPNSSLFVALCTPTADRLKDSEIHSDSMCFQTLHTADMSFTNSPYCVVFHLGFSAEELTGQSWYRLLHPDDLTVSASCHESLKDDGVSEVQLVVRLQCKDLSWLWIYTRATVDTDKQLITCTNHVISETEAVYLRQKLYSSVCPTFRESDRSRRKIQRLSENTDQYSRSSVTIEDQPAFFSTPPYSPTSSHSSDFLSEGSDPFEQLICDWSSASESYHFSSASSPASSHDEAFPLGMLSLVSHLYCNSPTHVPVCVTDTHLVPVYQPDGVLHPEEFSLFPLTQTHGRSSTPEPSPSAERHFHYSPTERHEISILAHQICSLANNFDVYGTPESLPANFALCRLPTTSQPTGPEPLLDERVIESFLRDLDVISEKQTDCVWNELQGVPAGTGAQLQALSVGMLKHTGPLESFSSETGISTHDELNQLNHCLYDAINRDGLTEESMY
ncbi:neuronal PAS domain-containing protein 4-like isoform X2 [Myxocyprinus asiaticus]|uniref:neuronal PAS domain-containing protein 4-like isoform X2 n=1 Tax=Myxocyprinus asiaticus TaxID=70543 RepID=UPI0022232111|nr:neuronal PAS domain-containing protein 4-like isoform X2 [Myxocyprinus asiaticus]